MRSALSRIKVWPRISTRCFGSAATSSSARGGGAFSSNTAAPQQEFGALDDGFEDALDYMSTCEGRQFNSYAAGDGGTEGELMLSERPLKVSKWERENDGWLPGDVGRRCLPALVDLQAPGGQKIDNKSVFARLDMLGDGSTDKKTGRLRRGVKPGHRRRPFMAPVKVRVLDVDRLPIEELHNAFLYTLVKRLPAEKCMRIASRIGVFRDKYNHVSYENLLRDCGKMFGTRYGPELLALFSRCHATISVPAVVDHVRRFGQFSKPWLSHQIERCTQPKLFDFVRYQKFGGVKPLPMIVTKPYALESYARMLSTSTAKRYIFDQLESRGLVPPRALSTDIDEALSAGARASERISSEMATEAQMPVLGGMDPLTAALCLPVPENRKPPKAPVEKVGDVEIKRAGSPRAHIDAKRLPPRPGGGLLDSIMEEQHQEQKVEMRRALDLENEDEWLPDEGEGDVEGGTYALQFGRIMDDAPTALVPEGHVHPMGEEGRASALVDQSSYSERHWKKQNRESFSYKEKVYAIEDGRWQRVGTKRWFTPRNKTPAKRRVMRVRLGIRKALWDHAQHVISKGD